jgi:hypothetical protein
MIPDDGPFGQALDSGAQCGQDRENRVSLLGPFASHRIESEPRLQFSRWADIQAQPLSNCKKVRCRTAYNSDNFRWHYPTDGRKSRRY